MPSQDSAVGRGLKTLVQAVIGFLVGLFFVVWAVPGVPHVVTSYVQNNLIQVSLMVGIPSGLTSYVWNLIRKDVPNT